MNDNENHGVIEPEIHLRDYLFVILVRKWFVILGFMAVLLSAIYYIVTTTPIYEAKVELLYEKYKSMPILIEGLDLMTNQYSLQLEAQKRILKSPTIVQDVAIRLNALEPDFNLTTKEIAKNLALSSPPQADNVLVLSATADSPKKAANLANIAADIYINKLTERKNADIDRATSFLRQQMEALDKMLQKDEEDLNQFRESQGLILGSKIDSRTGLRIGATLLSQLGQLQQDLEKTQMERELAKVQLSSVQELIDEKRKRMDADTQALLLSGGGASTIEQYQNKIMNLQLELNAMKQRGWSEKHPEVIAQKQKIDFANAQLEVEYSKIVQKGDMGSFDLISEWKNLTKQSNDLIIKIKSLEQKEKLLQGKVDQFKASHPELITKEVELIRLERQKRMREGTQTFLTNKYQEAQLLRNMQTADITIITKATEPESPIKPKKKLTLALAIVLGLMLGLGAAFFVEYMDDSLRRKEDVERWLNVPVIGMIPRILPNYPSTNSPALPEPNSYNANANHSSNLPIVRNVEHPDLPAPQGTSRQAGAQAGRDSNVKRRKKRRSKSHLRKNRELMARNLIHNEAKDIAESYRTLAANIQFANVDEPVKTVLVSSPVPTEGKTLTTGNLAITMARAGQKILLVDCDFRRPAQHRMFSQQREPGLSDYLIATNEDMSPDVSNGLIRETGVENLHFVTCGQIPPNPIALFASEKMKRLIEEWKVEYDIVLFDSPPILSVADASILASEVDTVVMVVQAGQTKRQTAVNAMEMLEKVGREIFGVVLNDIDFSKHYGSYYYYYYYYPRKYYDSDDEENA